MTVLDLVGLLLGVSAAFNVALATGITTRCCGLSTPECILVAGSAAGTAMLIFFAAVAAYR